jgi:hypothetical protein
MPTKERSRASGEERRSIGRGHAIGKRAKAKKKSGGKGSQSGAAVQGSAGGSGPVHEPSPVDVPKEESTKGPVSPSDVTLPIGDPGAPPKKSRNRKSRLQIREEQERIAAMDAKAKEEAKAALKAKRAEQAADIAPTIGGGVSLVMGMVARAKQCPEMQPPEEDCADVGEKAAAVVVKYFDLEGISVYKEEMALVWAVGGIAKHAMAAQSAARNTDRNDGDGQEPVAVAPPVI